MNFFSRGSVIPSLHPSPPSIPECNLALYVWVWNEQHPSTDPTVFFQCKFSISNSWGCVKMSTGDHGSRACLGLYQESHEGVWETTDLNYRSISPFGSDYKVSLEQTWYSTRQKHPTRPDGRLMNPGGWLGEWHADWNIRIYDDV